jgi:hypothetical protein
VVDSHGDLRIGLGERTAHAVRHIAILDHWGKQPKDQKE